MVYVTKKARRFYGFVAGLLGFIALLIGIRGGSVSDLSLGAKTAHADVPHGGGPGGPEGPGPGSPSPSPSPSPGPGPGPGPSPSPSPSPSPGNCCGNCQGGQSTCFIGSTQILMADSSTKNIADVKVGDEVMSFTTVTDELEPKLVTHVHTHGIRKVLRVGETFVTPEHRFLTAGGEYMPIGDLPTGTSLVLADGTLKEDWTRMETDEEQAVFNLTVADNHTYVADGFRVHNWK